jgi:hypothetical protein
MEDYLSIIRRLYGLSADIRHGYTERELSLAEQKLHCEFPVTLRQYYVQLGRNDAINTAYNRLLAPSEVYYTESKHLVFYEENQAVVVWGFPYQSPGAPNPGIWGSYDEERKITRIAPGYPKR